MLEQWDLNPEAQNKVDTNFTVIKIQVRDKESSVIKKIERSVMENIVRHGNGFAYWSTRLDEQVKAKLYVVTKGLHEWMQGDDELV